MDPTYLALMMVALGPNAVGSNGAAEAILYSSDMIPAGPRSLLAVNSAVTREQQATAQAEAYANKVASQMGEAFKKVVDVSVNPLPKETLDGLPDLKALFARLP